MSGWWTIALLLLVAASPARAGELHARLTTDLGPIDVKLYAKRAPRTVSSFVELARRGFFDGQIFNKVIPGFAVYSGDPGAPGIPEGGGPGYCFADEFGAGLAHDRPGILSMVSNGPGTNGSQFLITLAAAPVLDGRSPVFGEVTHGLDVLKRLAARPLVRGGRPASAVHLVKVEVLGDFKPVPFAKMKTYGKDELAAMATPKLRQVLQSLGGALDLGPLTGVVVKSVRSRCARSQITVRAHFKAAPEASLLVYGGTDGDIYRVKQMQFAAGEPARPSTEKAVK